MFLTSVGIVKEEGVSKLWQGVSAALMRHMVYSGTRIVSYITFKEKVFKKGKKDVFPIWQSAICKCFFYILKMIKIICNAISPLVFQGGVSAGAFAQFIASPTDLLKVQLQMEGKRRLLGLPPRVTGLFDAFSKIVKSSGYRGLWKGEYYKLSAR